MSLGWQLLQLPLQNIKAGKQREEVQAKPSQQFSSYLCRPGPNSWKIGKSKPFGPSLNGSDPSPLQNFLACTKLVQHVLFHASFSLSCIFKRLWYWKTLHAFFHAFIAKDDMAWEWREKREMEREWEIETRRRNFNFDIINNIIKYLTI